MRVIHKESSLSTPSPLSQFGKVLFCQYPIGRGGIFNKGMGTNMRICVGEGFLS